VGQSIFGPTFIGLQTVFVMSLGIHILSFLHCEWFVQCSNENV